MARLAARQSSVSSKAPQLFLCSRLQRGGLVKERASGACVRVASGRCVRACVRACMPPRVHSSWSCLAKPPTRHGKRRSCVANESAIWGVSKKKDHLIPRSPPPKVRSESYSYGLYVPSPYFLSVTPPHPRDAPHPSPSPPSAHACTARRHQATRT